MGGIVGIGFVVRLAAGFEGAEDTLESGVPQRRQAGSVAKLTRPHFGHLMLFMFDSKLRFLPEDSENESPEALIGGEKAMPSAINDS